MLKLSYDGAAYWLRYRLHYRHCYSEKRERMGRNDYDFVRLHFLLTRNLRDYLTLLLCLDCPNERVIVV